MIYGVISVLRSSSFLVLPLRVAPFPLAEIQTRAALKVFADPSALDLEREASAIAARYEGFRKEKGDNEAAIADAWFRFGFKEMFDYRDELYEFIASGTNDATRAFFETCMYRAMYERKYKRSGDNTSDQDLDEFMWQ